MVMEMLERYYSEFDAPRLMKFRKHLIPFCLKFYSDITEESFEELKAATKYFKSQYPSK